jgi:hypothetical protein
MSKSMNKSQHGLVRGSVTGVIILPNDARELPMLGLCMHKVSAAHCKVCKAKFQKAAAAAKLVREARAADKVWALARSAAA